MEFINYIAGNVMLIIGICGLFILATVWFVYAKTDDSDFSSEYVPTEPLPDIMQPKTKEETLYDLLQAYLGLSKNIFERMEQMEERLNKQILALSLKQDAFILTEFENNEKIDQIWNVLANQDVDALLQRLLTVTEVDAAEAQSLVDAIKGNSTLIDGREQIIQDVEARIKKVTKSKSKKVTKKVSKTKKKTKV